MAYTYEASHANGLPNPIQDPQFYKGVPFRRLVAWVIDSVIIVFLAVLAAIVFGVMTLGIGFLIAPLVGATVSFTYRCIPKRLPFRAERSGNPYPRIHGGIPDILRPSRFRHHDGHDRVRQRVARSPLRKHSY